MPALGSTIYKQREITMRVDDLFDFQGQDAGNFDYTWKCTIHGDPCPQDILQTSNARRGLFVNFILIVILLASILTVKTKVGCTNWDLDLIQIECRKPDLSQKFKPRDSNFVGQ